MSPRSKPVENHLREKSITSSKIARDHGGYLSKEENPEANRRNEEVCAAVAARKDTLKYLQCSTDQATGVKMLDSMPSPRVEAESTMETHYEERAKRLKLAKALLDDFGRFPPAEKRSGKSYMLVVAGRIDAMRRAGIT